MHKFRRFIYFVIKGFYIYFIIKSFYFVKYERLCNI